MPNLRPCKPLDLPMKVAKAFVKDMRACFNEPDAIERDEIAGNCRRSGNTRYGKAHHRHH